LLKIVGAEIISVSFFENMVADAVYKGLRLQNRVLNLPHALEKSMR
jgi:hypothetical protein